MLKSTRQSSEGKDKHIIDKASFSLWGNGEDSPISQKMTKWPSPFIRVSPPNFDSLFTIVLATITIEPSFFRIHRTSFQILHSTILTGGILICFENLWSVLFFVLFTPLKPCCSLLQFLFYSLLLILLILLFTHVCHFTISLILPRSFVPKYMWAEIIAPSYFWAS